jgi:hypothetical protein
MELGSVPFLVPTMERGILLCSVPDTDTDTGTNIHVINAPRSMNSETLREEVVSQRSIGIGGYTLTTEARG